jgi:hypothetical protein
MDLKEETKHLGGNELEKCVCCGNETNVRVDAHVDVRKYYIEGAGQLCIGCYTTIYP